MIRYLMEQRGLRQTDLLPVVGTRSVASAVINGQREPSKAHVKKLAEFFRVPPHPGETILEDFLKPMNMSVNQLAKHLHITAARLNDVVLGRRSITADTALRLARYFGTSAEVWLGIQQYYDLHTARIKAGRQIDRTIKPRTNEPAAA